MAEVEEKIVTVTMVQPEMTEKYGRLMPGYEVDLPLSEAVSFVSLGLAESDEVKGNVKVSGRVRRPNEEAEQAASEEDAQASAYNRLMNSSGAGNLIYRLEQRIAELESRRDDDDEAPRRNVRRPATSNRPGTQRTAGTAAQRQAQESTATKTPDVPAGAPHMAADEKKSASDKDE